MFFLSIDGAVSIIFFFSTFFLELQDHAISLCLFPSYHLVPEQIIHLNKAYGTTEIEPRPRAQQASTLSITPVLLGKYILEFTFDNLVHYYNALRYS